MPSRVESSPRTGSSPTATWYGLCDDAILVAEDLKHGSLQEWPLDAPQTPTETTLCAYVVRLPGQERRSTAYVPLAASMKASTEQIARLLRHRLLGRTHHDPAWPAITSLTPTSTVDVHPHIGAHNTAESTLLLSPELDAAEQTFIEGVEHPLQLDYRPEPSLRLKGTVTRIRTANDEFSFSQRDWESLDSLLERSSEDA